MSKINSEEAVLNKLKSLKETIDRDESDEEVEKALSQLINAVISLGRYNAKKWRYTFTKEWWNVFEKISETNQYNNIISLLKNKIRTETDSQKREGLIYIYIETEVSHLNTMLNKEDAEFLAKDLLKKQEYKEAIKYYRHNLEIMNSIANILFYTQETENIGKSLFYKQEYIESQEKIVGKKELSRYIYQTFNVHFHLVKCLQRKKDYERAKRELSKIENYHLYPSGKNNIVILFRENIENIMETENLINENNNDMTRKMELSEEKNKKQSIQQLSIFTAVITFILTAASTASSEQFSIFGMLGLGFVLIMFVCAINIYPTSKRSKNDSTKVVFFSWQAIFFCFALFGALMLAGIQYLESRSATCLMGCETKIIIPSVPQPTNHIFPPFNIGEQKQPQ